MTIYHPDSITLDVVEKPTIAQRVKAGYTACVASDILKFCVNNKQVNENAHYIRLSGCTNYLDFNKSKIYNEAGEEIKPLLKHWSMTSKFTYLMNLDINNLESIEVFVTENPTDADSWTSIGVIDVVLPLYINNKEDNPERMLLPCATNEKTHYIDDELSRCPRSIIEKIDDFNGICIDADESRYYYYCLSTGLCGIITNQTGMMKNGTRVIIRTIETDDDCEAGAYVADGGCIVISNELTDDQYLCYLACYCGHIEVAVKGAFGYGHSHGESDFSSSIADMINILYSHYNECSHDDEC